MDGTEAELRKELWMWRGVAILFILILSLTTIVTFYLDRNQHMRDNIERAAHWQKIEDGVGQNNEAIQRVDEHLRQCSGCHTHPPVFPPRDIK
jgi:hypothetical protein